MGGAHPQRTILKTKHMRNLRKLQDQADSLLEMAEDMQRRINSLKDVDRMTMGFAKPNYDRIDTCERGKKRLLESYKRVLIEILETI
jgi:hypothetical protein